MENASKALLISASILIGMLVLSIGIYLFSNYRETGSSYGRKIEATEIQKFNSNFTKFEGRTNIKIQEIVTIAKFAKQHKEQTGFTTEVYLVGEGNLLDKDEDDFINLIQGKSTENDGTIIYFSTQKIQYDDNGRVEKIIFNN